MMLLFFFGGNRERVSIRMIMNTKTKLLNGLLGIIDFQITRRELNHVLTQKDRTRRAVRPNMHRVHRSY